MKVYNNWNSDTNIGAVIQAALGQIKM
jgi:hypothetical protein